MLSHFHQSPVLCNPMDWGLLGSSIYGTLQARILEWVAMPSCRGPYWPRDQTCISCLLHCQVGSLPPAPRGKLTLPQAQKLISLWPNAWENPLQISVSLPSSSFSLSLQAFPLSTSPVNSGHLGLPNLFSNQRNSRLYLISHPWPVTWKLSRQ